MQHAKRLIIILIFLAVIGGTLVWAMQKPADHGGLVWISDVKIEMKGKYNDLDPFGHVLTSWEATASASNWRQAQNLDMLSLQGERAFAYVSHLAIWSEIYKVDLDIRFLQNGNVATAFDGGLLIREYSFTVNMPALAYQQDFAQSLTFSGIKPGTYTIQFTIQTGQYFQFMAGCPACVQVHEKTVSFDVAFTNP